MTPESSNEMLRFDILLGDPNVQIDRLTNGLRDVTS